MGLQAKSVVLKAPLEQGVPGLKDFEIKTTEVNDKDLPEGAILIKALVFSADPYLRGGIKTMAAGSVMSGFIAGKVLESKNAAWKAGDLFGTTKPFTTVQILTEKDLKAAPFWKLTDYIKEDQISLGVGILGMPGSTAYAGFVDVLKPNKGETLFVSGAAGAVGSMVGQLAKHVYGCKVIGSCGGPEKSKFIKEKCGFDEAIDYKQCSNRQDLIAALKKVAPDGIDMYFENVGGMHFEAAVASLRTKGRIAVCGSISSYNDKDPVPEQINIFALIYKAVRIEGFTCFPWLSEGSFLPKMAAWYKEGKIHVEETRFTGVDNWATGFESLFKGGNTGKVIIDVSKD